LWFVVVVAFHSINSVLRAIWGLGFLGLKLMLNNGIRITLVGFELVVVNSDYLLVKGN